MIFTRTLHNLRDLLHEASLDPTRLFCSRLRLLFFDPFSGKFEVSFWSLSDFCLGDFRDLQAMLISGVYELDHRCVITILLAVALRSKSGDVGL
ncbi:hypothetical protein ACE6H2_009839 [Prunus campanulata]